MPTSTPLSPTRRSTPRRESDRAQSDRAALLAVLDASLICHLAVVVDEVPLALPTVFGVDLDGPDQDGTVYLHGSVASRSLVAGPAQEISVTWTVLDGIVLARSAFHHSMNYRSAVAIGRPRVVTDPDEKARALDLVVDHVVPGRSAALREHTRKELAATVVLALPLHEASVKQRTGGPNDDAPDVASGEVWAGELPLRLVAAPPSPAEDLSPADRETPEHVVRRLADFR
ncbi:MAG TPA: pyridoxamine 5'-phosphate oxidase family protein [Nocardioidaceae bacterium]|nr:pyridoxamine 5'-phosphate oxidase family protein [Nocardioidaceae bacterium]